MVFVFLLSGHLFLDLMFRMFQEIFHLIVSTFSGLSDKSGPSFGRRVVILETLARYRSCVVMLDLECDDLVKEMFSTFLAVARLVLKHTVSINNHLLDHLYLISYCFFFGLSQCYLINPATLFQILT